MKHRASDTFSRFYWVPVLVIGLVGYALDANPWLLGALGLAAVCVLSLFDRAYRARTTKDHPTQPPE